MSLDCVIYRCSKQTEMYLYLRAGVMPDQLPPALRERTGTLFKVMDLRLDAERQLARVDVATVRQRLVEQGYYLQMPPNGQISAKLNFGGG